MRPAKKEALDWSDPHLLATLATLAVSVPIFVYFLVQMIKSANDWDVAFDEDGKTYSQKARFRERLAQHRAQVATLDPAAPEVVPEAPQAAAKTLAESAVHPAQPGGELRLRRRLSSSGPGGASPAVLSDCPAEPASRKEKDD
ncbi:hypothetical protein DIPPA_22053 [Diplonema papillatum]|nr:hypothetical protein DIPPA_22053 [Diplonema papillatum]|eukprot:gene6548-10002_t